ncbi:hypothetical protein SDC9_51242 [bioreactor metagenome]|uniref:Uncharacterized protein n=1 Tax=bioreactor metagenome TaxID=1076179 RepID=A0A644WN74_9ZZZZ
MEETENKSTLDALAEIARLTNRKVFVSEAPYPGTTINPVVLHKRTVYMPDTKNDRCFLAGFSDPKSFDKNNMFFGVFFTVPYSESSTFEIRKKDTLDRMNPFLASKTHKIESGNFNSAAVIKGNDERLMNRILVNGQTQQLIIDALSLEGYWFAGLNAVNLSFVPDMQQHSCFGIYTRQTWITNRERIEELFSLAAGLSKQMND